VRSGAGQAFSDGQEQVQLGAAATAANGWALVVAAPALLAGRIADLVVEQAAAPFRPAAVG
jgi:hypothetical protein